MTKRLIDIDDALVAGAGRVLGTTTMKDAVNRSLEEVLKADLRRRHADQLASMDGLDLDDDEVMAGAWH